MLWLIRSDQCHHSVIAADLMQAMPSGRVVPSGRGGAVRSPSQNMVPASPSRAHRYLFGNRTKRQRRSEVGDVRRSRGHVVGGRTKCASRHKGPWRPPPPGWVGEQAHIRSLFSVLCMNTYTLCTFMSMHCDDLNRYDAMSFPPVLCVRVVMRQ